MSPRSSGGTCRVSSACRPSGVRVRGMLGNGRYNAQPYDPRYGNNGGGYGYGGAEFSFRCDVDYRGYVRNVRVEPGYRHY